MAIELMNLKGNITLGGEVSGQVELDNTITEEIREIIEEVDGLTIEEVQEVIPGEKQEVDGAEVFNDYRNNEASGKYSTASGYATKATANYANAEGYFSEATGNMAHAEGYKTKAKGSSSHAEGSASEALNSAAHAEGDQTKASGYASHSEGGFTEAQAGYAHAEGYKTIAKGNNSHTEGRYTVASGRAQQVLGRWNVEDTEIDEGGYGKYIQIIGNGNEETEERSNAYTLDWDGNAWYQGLVQAAGFIDAEGNPIGGMTEITKETFIDELDTGIYRINSVDFDYALWLDDTYCISLGNGIAIITRIEELEVYRWMVIGRDENWSVITQEGYTEYNSDDDYWEATVFGEVENTFNRVYGFNERTISNHQYPTTKAVVNYVDSKLADVGGEKIHEITLAKSERTYIQNLQPGFYVVHAPEGGLIVGGTSLHGVKGDSHIMISGDMTQDEADAAGISKFRKSYFLGYAVIGNAASNTYGVFEGVKTDGAWKYTKIDGGQFQNTGNKAIAINDTTAADNVKYPSVKAVKTYVDEKTTPKVFEKIATYTVAPDADGNLPNKFTIDKDDNGEAFQLTDLYCDVLLGLTDGTAGRFYIQAGNPNVSGGTISLIGNGNWGFTNTALRKWCFRLDNYGDGRGGLVSAPSGSTIANGTLPNANVSALHGQPIPPNKIIDITQIQFIGQVGTTKTFMEGTTVTLWGVRK